MDYGHEQADKDLKRVEARIRNEYRQASHEVEKKLQDYLKAYEKEDKIMAERVKNNEMTEAKYLKWRSDQITMGGKWLKLRDELVDIYLDTNKSSSDMIWDHAYQLYADNFNFGTFEVEKGARINTSFTLYDKDTVKRLVKDDPTILPPPESISRAYW